MSEAAARNLLVLLCDQQQTNVLGPYGGPAPTPTWDRMAEAGVVFERYYCATPMCVPTRPSMMNGRWPHQHGALCNSTKAYATLHEGEELLIDRLQDAGYQVGYEGIWHINRPQQDDRRGEYAHFVSSGFPYELQGKMLTEQGRQADAQRAAVLTPTDHGDEDAQISVPVPATWTRPIEDHPDMMRARQVAEFIVNAPPKKPVAAWCSLGGPHPPLLLPKPYMSLFDPAEVEPPPGLGAEMSELPRSVRGSPGALGVEGWGWDRWSVAVAAYLGYTAFVDRCLGIVLQAMEESGRLEEAVVIISTDHGEMLGSHNIYQKFVMYDRSARVPFIIRAPGIEPGRRAHLASQTDLAPTVLELLGQPPLERAEGQSLAPILRDESTPSRPYTFSEYNGWKDGGFKMRAIVSERFKYVYSHEDQDQLFDLERDPDELTNLVDDAAHGAIVRELRTALHHWMRATEDFITPTWANELP
jgi:arylsulfatase A-like enzyme